MVWQIRCSAREFRISREQSRVISRMNRFLNNGTVIKSDPIPNVKIPVDQTQPVKRDSESKARRKRILRRLAKGKPVEKGLLRNPPKSLEYRLAEGIQFEVRSEMEIALIGTGHELTVKFVPEEIADSPKGATSREERVRIYKKRYGDRVREQYRDEEWVNEQEWMMEGTRGSSCTISSKRLRKLYYMHYRLNGIFSILLLFNNH